MTVVNSFATSDMIAAHDVCRCHQISLKNVPHVLTLWSGYKTSQQTLHKFGLWNSHAFGVSVTTDGVNVDLMCGLVLWIDSWFGFVKVISALVNNSARILQLFRWERYVWPHWLQSTPVYYNLFRGQRILFWGKYYAIPNDFCEVITSSIMVPL